MAANFSDALTTKLAIGDLDKDGRSETSCEVVIAEGSGSIERVAAEWRAIEDAGGVASPFQSLAVARAAGAAHLENDETPRIVLICERGRPLVIFPTVVGQFVGVPAIRFLGDPFIQYGDAIADPGATPAHIEAAWAAATDESIASVAIFRRVRADGVLSPILARNTSIIAEDQAPLVDLQKALTLKSHHTRELRRLRRRMSEQGELSFEILQGMAATEVLRETFSFKRDWLIQRGLPSVVFGNPRWENVVFELACAGGRQPEMLIARLAINNVTAATEIGFVNRQSWFAYIGALAPEFAKLGPGHILMDELITWCRNSGLKTYDLLAPFQPYKLALATRAVPMCDYAVALGLAGYPAVLAARLIPTGKNLIAKVPLSLRQKFVRGVLNAANK